SGSTIASRLVAPAKAGAHFDARTVVTRSSTVAATGSSHDRRRDGSRPSPGRRTVASAQCESERTAALSSRSAPGGDRRAARLPAAGAGPAGLRAILSAGLLGDRLVLRLDPVALAAAGRLRRARQLREGDRRPRLRRLDRDDGRVRDLVDPIADEPRARPRA